MEISDPALLSIPIQAPQAAGTSVKKTKTPIVADAATEEEEVEEDDDDDVEEEAEDQVSKLRAAALSMDPATEFLPTTSSAPSILEAATTSSSPAIGTEFKDLITDSLSATDGTTSTTTRTTKKRDSERRQVQIWTGNYEELLQTVTLATLLSISFLISVQSNDLAWFGNMKVHGTMLVTADARVILSELPSCELVTTLPSLCSMYWI
jgi:hypothetical protein